MNEKSSGGSGGGCQMARIVPELQDLASSWNEMNGFDKVFQNSLL